MTFILQKRGYFLFISFCLFIAQIQIAQADDWGCQVALCMANPAGPMALAECVPPMERLYNVLSHHGSWPNCTRSSAPQQAASQPFSSNPNSAFVNQPINPTPNSGTGQQ